MNNKEIQKNCFMQFKKMANDVETKEDLKNLEKQFKRFSDCFGIYKPTVESFLIAKNNEFKEAQLKALIKPFEAWEALDFNLKGLETVDKKIKAIKDIKVKNSFEGLFNLLTDSKNLTYNPLRVRQEVINDLNKFKSLNFFKVGYVSQYDLAKKYSFLAVKGGSQKFHSKLYFIEHGLYILKTLEHDGVTLKAFYIGNKYKTLLGSTSPKVLRGEKFNISCLNAYKVLNKEDSIKYYSYVNKNGLDKKSRSILKAIRGHKTMSFDCLIEETEQRIEQLNEKINGYYESEESPFSISELVHDEWELKELEDNLYNWTTEDNSLSSVSTLEDFNW